jgi:hypothetical protein
MNEDVAFVFSAVEVFSDEKKYKRENYVLGETGIYQIKKFISESLLTGYIYPNSPGLAIFRMKDLKKSLVCKLKNKFNENFLEHSIGIDRLIFLLIAKDYEKFGYVNEKLAFFRDHPGGITPSSSIEKLLFCHTIAKTYFVENHKNTMTNRLFLNYNTSILINEFPENQYKISSYKQVYEKEKTSIRDHLLLHVFILYKKIEYKIKLVFS